MNNPRICGSIAIRGLDDGAPLTVGNGLNSGSTPCGHSVEMGSHSQPQHGFFGGFVRRQLTGNASILHDNEMVADPYHFGQLGRNEDHGQTIGCQRGISL